MGRRRLLAMITFLWSLSSGSCELKHISLWNETNCLSNISHCVPVSLATAGRFYQTFETSNKQSSPNKTEIAFGCCLTVQSCTFFFFSLTMKVLTKAKLYHRSTVKRFTEVEERGSSENLHRHQFNVHSSHLEWYFFLAVLLSFTFTHYFTLIVHFWNGLTCVLCTFRNGLKLTVEWHSRLRARTSPVRIWVEQIPG